MADFFNARITHIYLVYGLGFFTLGLAVALEAGRTSESRFARALRPLAIFGIFHGFHEWIEMFEITGAIAYGFVPAPWWLWSRLVLLSLSFTALLTFGVIMLSNRRAGMWGGLGMLTLVSAGVFALGVRMQGQQQEWLDAADAWVRYSLGIPGALLAAIGMVTEWHSLKRTELTSFANNYLWAGVLFALYGLFGQTVVPQSTLFPSSVYNTETFFNLFGVPIQLVRGILAGSIAFFVIRGMRAFEVDRQLKLAAAQRQAQEAVTRREALRGDLLRRTVAAQEDERSRLARELHDDTLQVLTGLSAGLKGTEQLMDSDPDRARAQLSQLATMSSHAIGELRRLIVNLRPSVLDDLGLVAAIRWYITSLDDRVGSDVDIQVSGLEDRLPTAVETTLFRIVQEGLNNIARHAHAHNVIIQLHCDRDQVRLEIQDDGVGFNPDIAMDLSKSHPGWGLMGIKERTKLAGGEFRIESQEKHGTRLWIEIPIQFKNGSPTDCFSERATRINS